MFNYRDHSRFSLLLTEGSNHLARLVFSAVDSQETTNIEHILDMSKRMMWSLVRWYEKFPAIQISLAITSQATATAFISFTLCYLYKRDFRSLWWLVGMCDRFFEILVGGGKISLLRPLILDIIHVQEPAVSYFL